MRAAFIQIDVDLAKLDSSVLMMASQILSNADEVEPLEAYTGDEASNLNDVQPMKIWHRLLESKQDRWKRRKIRA